MNNILDIETLSDDELRKEMFRYRFVEKQMLLVLDEYILFERPSKRHKWIEIKHYGAWSSLHDKMSRDDVPVNEYVREEVLRRFRVHVQVEPIVVFEK